MDNENKDYEVGYKKPPKEYQFKTGHSGNPKGRPKLVKDFKTDLVEELEEIIEINEFGKKKTMTKQRAFIKRVVAGALGGNATYIRILVQLLTKHGKESEIEETEDITADDQELLNLFLERNR